MKLTSSIAPKDEDSSRDPWSCGRFAVRRPGSPADISGEVTRRILRGLKARIPAPQYG